MGGLVSVCLVTVIIQLDFFFKSLYFLTQNFLRLSMHERVSCTKETRFVGQPTSNLSTIYGVLSFSFFLKLIILGHSEGNLLH